MFHWRPTNHGLKRTNIIDDNPFAGRVADAQAVAEDREAPAADRAYALVIVWEDRAPIAGADELDEAQKLFRAAGLRKQAAILEEYEDWGH